MSVQNDTLFDDLDRALNITDTANWSGRLRRSSGLIAEHNHHKPAQVEEVPNLNPLDVRVVKTQVDNIDISEVESQHDKAGSMSQTHDD